MVRNFKKRSSAPEEELRGDTLAIQLNKFQRSKSLVVQQVRTTEDSHSKINSTMFSVEDFS